MGESLVILILEDHPPKEYIINTKTTTIQRRKTDRSKKPSGRFVYSISFGERNCILNDLTVSAD